MQKSRLGLSDKFVTAFQHHYVDRSQEISDFFKKIYQKLTAYTELKTA